MYEKKFFYVEKQISQQKLEKIMMLGDKSIRTEERISRIYPHGELYSHIIGQIDDDNNGISGIEKYFDKEIITPGIRISSKLVDQKRVMSPRDAFKQGSDWLVIGRDLTKGNIKSNFKKLSDHLSQWHWSVKYAVCLTQKY